MQHHFRPRELGDGHSYWRPCSVRLFSFGLSHARGRMCPALSPRVNTSVPLPAPPVLRQWPQSAPPPASKGHAASMERAWSPQKGRKTGQNRHCHPLPPAGQEHRNIRSRRPRLLLPNPSADTGNAKESCIPQRRPREPTGCRKNPPPETPVAGFRRALNPRFSPKIAAFFT